MKLSIVIPAYNEVPRLPHTLAAIRGFFHAATDDLSLHEVIIADDGSTDGTPSLVESWKARLPMKLVALPGNRGKGAAVKEGMLAATGDLLLMYDADGATPIEEVTRLFNAMKTQNADIAIGSRVDASTSVSMQIHRRLIGRVYHALCSGLHPGIRDAACGCKLFKQSVARDLFSRQTVERFAFDVEILSLAIRKRYRIAEVPVQWSAVEKSKVRIIRDGIQMFASVIGLYWKKWTVRA